MHSKHGSIMIVAGLVIAALIVVGVLVYKFTLGNNYSMDQYSQNSISNTEPVLTATDEILDIEEDLNTTATESLDADILGITSEVE